MFDDVFPKGNRSVLVLDTLNYETGKYTCLAKNSEDEDRRSFYANIRRLGMHEDIDKIARRIVVKENEKLELTCPYRNFDNITWYLNGNQVKGAKFGKVLSIGNATREQSGAWKCNVSIGSENGSFSYEVSVLATPLIFPAWIENGKSVEFPQESDIDEKNVKLNRSLILNCNADGYPKPEIKWIKSRSVVGSDRLLKFNRLEFKDR
jgi:Immunoglobulin domain